MSGSTTPDLPDAALGEPYLASIVASYPPGPPTSSIEIVSGRVPDGTRFLRNTLENRPAARVSGTPVRARHLPVHRPGPGRHRRDGATARRTFTIRVLQDQQARGSGVTPR